jgi:hypothetical protein
VKFPLHQPISAKCQFCDFGLADIYRHQRRRRSRVFDGGRVIGRVSSAAQYRFSSIRDG